MRSRNLPSLPSESKAILPGDVQPVSEEQATASDRSELADVEEEVRVEVDAGRVKRGRARTLLYDGRATVAGLTETNEVDENDLVDGTRMGNSEEDMLFSGTGLLCFCSVVGDTRPLQLNRTGPRPHGTVT